MSILFTFSAFIFTSDSYNKIVDDDAIDSFGSDYEEGGAKCLVVFDKETSQEMMQGNIWISPKSHGQTHSMQLVLRFQTRPLIKRMLPGYSPELQNPNSNSILHKLKITLAYDDVNSTVTKWLLEKQGCEVTVVSSGFECLTALSNVKMLYRVVILDLEMPEMDGFEEVMNIRKFTGHHWPLIIALTASTQDHITERCLQMGMNGMIQKPVLLHVMAYELRRTVLSASE